MRYDELYARRAARAVEQGVIDLRTFLDELIAGGVPPDRALDLVLDDLENDGPVFGRFVRQLAGAAQASVAAAERQGYTAGVVAASREEALERLRRHVSVPDALTSADPAQLELIEASAAEHLDYTWVAELVNTCHLCLPLHGTSRTLAEWRELGLHPDTIHPASWASACHCSLVPAGEMPRDEVMAPLRREKLKTTTGLKGSRQTRRRVAQVDLEKSLAAVEEARASEVGRRTLRLLGQANAD